MYQYFNADTLSDIFKKEIITLTFKNYYYLVLPVLLGFSIITEYICI